MLRNRPQVSVHTLTKNKASGQGLDRQISKGPARFTTDRPAASVERWGKLHMSKLNPILLICALVMGFGASVSATPASAQDESAETQRLVRECRNGRGDAAACGDLAYRLYNGIGATKDDALALRVADAGCSKGSAIACLNAGVVLRWSDSIPRDFVQSFAFFERGCGLSNALACLNVGYMRRDGPGVEINAELARRGFSLACANSNGEGCVQQGRIYADGLGNVGKHDGNAVNSYRAGCALDYLEACALAGYMAFNGRGTPIDANYAMRQYMRACEGGVDFACSNLLVVREGGPDGPGYAELATLEAVARAFPSELPPEQRFILAGAAFQNGDIPLAIGAFEALAQEGVADAAFNLGQIYYSGLGVPKDQRRAVRYFERAVDAGHPYAMFIMAQFYRSGFIVDFNEIWAIQLMRAAAEKGIADADPIWRTWQSEMDARFNQRDAEIREMARQNEASQAQADAANMARIWGLYSSGQNRQDNGQVCGTIYRSGQANYECMARETFDRYYNPNR